VGHRPHKKAGASSKEKGGKKAKLDQKKSRKGRCFLER